MSLDEDLGSRGDPSVRIDESGKPVAVGDHDLSSRGNPSATLDEDLGSRGDLSALVDESGKPVAVTDNDLSSRGWYATWAVGETRRPESMNRRKPLKSMLTPTPMPKANANANA